MDATNFTSQTLLFVSCSPFSLLTYFYATISHWRLCQLHGQCESSLINHCGWRPNPCRLPSSLISVTVVVNLSQTWVLQFFIDVFSWAPWRLLQKGLRARALTLKTPCQSLVMHMQILAVSFVEDAQLFSVAAPSYYFVVIISSQFVRSVCCRHQWSNTSNLLVPSARNGQILRLCIGTGCTPARMTRIFVPRLISLYVRSTHYSS